MKSKPRKPKTPHRSGRPTASASQDLDRHILRTATRLFTDQGYAATSIEQIALVAGSGKQTIYRRYPSKQDLFNAVINELGGVLFDSSTLSVTRLPDPLATLRETCRALIDVASNPDAVAMYRVLIAESNRFPALARHALNGIVDPFGNIVAGLIRVAREAGQIRSDSDDQTLGQLLIGILTGWPIQQALLGQQGMTGKAERAAFFERAWSVFLDGVRVRRG